METPPKRFREYGFAPGLLNPGPRNLITDVAGVRVGHRTIREGEEVRTGVTVVDPGVPELFRRKLPAAIAVGNGFGKLAGYTQVEELGTLETPVALTNTLAVGPVMRGLVNLTLAHTPDLQPAETINAVVGETNDGLLNAIHRDVVGPADVELAYEARTDWPALGCVGAGTGTRAFSWKGGIGSASRRVPVGEACFTVGVLVQANFGGALRIMGVPVGQLLGSTSFDRFLPAPAAPTASVLSPTPLTLLPTAPDGSCMIVLATDAPLTARQLKRVARRSLLGLAVVGAVMAHGSGDYAVAFSTSRAGLEGESSNGPGSCLPDARLDPFFLAACEAVEESVYDALFCAETTQGRGGMVLERLPVETVVELLRNRVGTRWE